MNSIRGKNVFTIFLCFVLCFSALIFAAGCSGNNRHEEQPYIVSFEKTSSENSEDVYTITYSDGTTSQFTVTNGKDGNDLSISENLGSLYKGNRHRSYARRVYRAIPEFDGRLFCRRQ